MYLPLKHLGRISFCAQVNCRTLVTLVGQYQLLVKPGRDLLVPSALYCLICKHSQQLYLLPALSLCADFNNVM